MRAVIIDDERPARKELQYQLEEIMSDIEIVEGESGADALRLAGEGAFELFFLDINLGDIEGTKLVKAVKSIQPKTKVIFVTAYSQYAVEAFELGVDDYVMKPFQRERIEKVLSKVLEEPVETEKEQQPLTRLGISCQGKVIFEDIDDIIYMETYNRGCLIHTKDRSYEVSKSIGDYEKKLEGTHFFRIHKSYLIHLDKVKEVFPWHNKSYGVKMIGYEDEILPVGREKSKQFKKMVLR